MATRCVEVECAGITARLVLPAGLAAAFAAEVTDFAHRFFDATPAHAVDFTIRVSEGVPELAGLRQLGGDVLSDGRTVAARRRERWLQYWVVWPQGSRSKGLRVFAPGGLLAGRGAWKRWLAGTFWTPRRRLAHCLLHFVYLPRLMVEGLARGFSFVHAAGLVTPGGVVLIAGDTRAGKTHALLTLATRYPLLGDDYVLLRDHTVYGIPKRVGIHGHHGWYDGRAESPADAWHWRAHSWLTRALPLDRQHARRSVSLSSLGAVEPEGALRGIIYLRRTAAGGSADVAVDKLSPEAFAARLKPVLRTELTDFMQSGYLWQGSRDGPGDLSSRVAEAAQRLEQELAGVPLLDVGIPYGLAPGEVLANLVETRLLAGT